MRLACARVSRPLHDPCSGPFLYDSGPLQRPCRGPSFFKLDSQLLDYLLGRGPFRPVKFSTPGFRVKTASAPSFRGLFRLFSFSTLPSGFNALGYKADWDERDWFQASGITNETVGAKHSTGNSGTGKPRNEVYWFNTPFGYYVPWGDHTEHLVEYYAWTQPIDSDGPWQKPGWRTKVFFHAWFATYPKEVLKRLR